MKIIKIINFVQTLFAIRLYMLRLDARNRQEFEVFETQCNRK